MFSGVLVRRIRYIFGSVSTPNKIYFRECLFIEYNSYIFGCVCVDLTVRNAVLCEYHSN